MENRIYRLSADNCVSLTYNQTPTVSELRRFIANLEIEALAVSISQEKAPLDAVKDG